MEPYWLRFGLGLRQVEDKKDSGRVAAVPHDAKASTVSLVAGSTS